MMKKNGCWYGFQCKRHHVYIKPPLLSKFCKGSQYICHRQTVTVASAGWHVVLQMQVNLKEPGFIISLSLESSVSDSSTVNLCLFCMPFEFMFVWLLLLLLKPKRYGV
ncbi:hypothetical protein DsansV1_C01g0005401 [Dioscorea sansibarensis]